MDTLVITTRIQDRVHFENIVKTSGDVHFKCSAHILLYSTIFKRLNVSDSLLKFYFLHKIRVNCERWVMFLCLFISIVCFNLLIYLNLHGQIF